MTGARMKTSDAEISARISGVVNESVTDGPGMRIVVFFQGCGHHCPGCHNPDTWDFNRGDIYQILDLLKHLEISPLIQGVTLSGGDPFYQPRAAAAVAEAFHRMNKDVWAYTGFTWETLMNSKEPAIHALLSQCDVLVDGPFLQAQKTLAHPFRGSSNQRIIDVPQSLRNRMLISWEGLNGFGVD